jgi:hypothetical protein
VIDTQSGFRVYPLALFEDVHPRSGGFVFETEVLVAAAAFGWDVVEVDIRTIPCAARRSRFRPLIDGAAIAAFLAKRVAARWGAELAAGVSEAAVLSRGGRSAWRHPRLRRAWVAAGATLATPLLAAAAIAQTVVPSGRMDVVGPLVERLYSQTRLGSL